jgi:hypothetical protein
MILTGYSFRPYRWRTYAHRTWTLLNHTRLGWVNRVVCVMGLLLTVSSAERQQVNVDHGVVRYKFVFQWCEGQDDP